MAHLLTRNSGVLQLRDGVLHSQLQESGLKIQTLVSVNYVCTYLITSPESFQRRVTFPKS